MSSNVVQDSSSVGIDQDFETGNHDTAIYCSQTTQPELLLGRNIMHAEPQLDPRDVHARDRTFLSSLRTVFQLTILSAIMGRLLSTSAIVASAVFLTFAISILISSTIRHEVNRQTMNNGFVCVDGVSPLVFFVLGIAAVIGSLVYIHQRVITTNM